MGSGERDVEADLECGGAASEEEGSKECLLVPGRRKKTLSRAQGGALNYSGSIKEEDGNSSPAAADCPPNETIQLMVEKNSSSNGVQNSAEKPSSKEKRKKTNPKRPPKPPRPPKGPSLSASDLKLVREISELAAKKRARIERARALRRTKASKGSSSSTNSSSSSITALIITILFFIVIIVQGLRTRNGFEVGFQGSPEPAAAAEGLIAMKFYDSPSSEMNGPISRSPSAIEEASGWIPQEEEHGDPGLGFRPL